MTGGGEDVVLSTTGAEVVAGTGGDFRRTGGLGGAKGTFSGGIVEAEDGVAGVELGVVKGPVPVEIVGISVLTGTFGLCEPGRKTASELLIEPFWSAKCRC